MKQLVFIIYQCNETFVEPFKKGFRLDGEEMNDLSSQQGFCGLFILLICNVSSGRFYCELHSEELELADGAEPSSEVGHRQNRSV